MLRAAIRSAVKKYKIKDALNKLENPNHHKIMRNELTMNIFPFGDDGADPSIIIKLVKRVSFIFDKNLYMTLHIIIDYII